MKKKLWIPGILFGVILGWLAVRYYWIRKFLENIDVQKAITTHPYRRKRDYHFPATRETTNYLVSHTVQEGIERIVYTPKQPRFNTPILFVHGMWHSASCWRLWQELLAEWGWESISFSLPGHGGSPLQRPIVLSTLDYYLGFLKAEVDRMNKRPVMIGHDMGGALIQWYLKYVGDLPAVVMAASWDSHSFLRDSMRHLFRLDPLGCVQMVIHMSASPLIRNPLVTAKKLTTEGSVFDSDQLHTMIGQESALVMYQHNSPFWYPPTVVHTPVLWLAGEADAIIGEESSRKSATYYRADYVMVKNVGHDLMIERLFSPTVEMIHSWLLQHTIS